MSRAASLADFFPHAPAVLHHKPKKASQDTRRTEARPVDLSLHGSSSSAAQLPAAQLEANNKNTRANNRLVSNLTARDDEDIQQGDPGDMLNGVGSASSLASTVSSVFSSNPSAMPSYPGATSHSHSLTPLTNTEFSPPGKTLSPGAIKHAQVHTRTGSASPYGTLVDNSHNVSGSMTPVHTPPEPNLQARPGPGEKKGDKMFYDPELDERLPSKDRKKQKARYKEFGAEPDPIPPPDPRLALAGYSAGLYNRKGATNKAKLRIAPYKVKPYTFDPRISIGPGPSDTVVITGFDPFTSETQLKTVFGSYGDIAELSNKTDPSTGSFLGICTIKYKDSRIRGIKGVDAAKAAEKEGTGQRIGVCEVKVRCDRGRRCKALVEEALKRNKEEQEKFRAAEATKKPPQPATPTVDVSGPPPDAPKGPSGKGMRPPEGPRAVLPPRPAAHALVETEPIIDKIKRKPYIFIAHCYVPVLGTTIAHLKKRLKLYDWREVRVDRSGYYIIFEDSKRGEDETERCYNECNMTALFTYVMNMECQKYGNPNYERSPSPERALAEKRQKEELERIWREDEADFEEEKRQRAQQMDPVKGALEQLFPELVDRIMSDVKSRITAPALYDYLDPDRHVAKRRKLNIPDPAAKETTQPALFLTRGDDTPSIGTPDARAGFSGAMKRKRLSRYDPSFARGRKDAIARPVNAFADERRKRPPPRPRDIQPLHFRLQNFFGDEEDSDDEQRTSITRDTEDQESRPLSRMSRSSTVFEDHEELDGLPKSKRRRLDAGWGAESDEEGLDEIARRSLGHLLDKEPEDMAMRELEQVLSTLPRSSKLRKRALAEVTMRKRAEKDDELFFGSVKPTKDEKTDGVAVVDILLDDAASVDQVLATSETGDALAKALTKKKPKAKKKTKKQIFEEREALKAQAKSAKELVQETVDEAMTPDIADEEEDKLEDLQDEEPRAEVEWLGSTDKPRRTVEDDVDAVLDIDGWQHLVKDDEDMRFLQQSLEKEAKADLGDIGLWTWKQKEIKALNNGGVHGVVRSEAKIVAGPAGGSPGIWHTHADNYYVPNPSGCARTEGVKKILESEKSKYLPHRIRVQKQREEREARAKNDPALATEAAKLAAAAKLASTASSRTNRANNRRLVNDINTQKQTLSAEGDAIRFNQLKKRKKLVKFDRSAIHNWGLYAEENIAVNDMIIEYVGDRVRQRVADLREQRYLKQGIGSSYLFRIDEDTVIDATKKGGIARFINHSCTPNCTAKIIKVDGTKRIVIYALRDIAKNEELTYDYKFEREINSDDRIPCLCGSVGCKGFLN